MFLMGSFAILISFFARFALQRLTMLMMFLKSAVCFQTSLHPLPLVRDLCGRRSMDGAQAVSWHDSHGSFARESTLVKLLWCARTFLSKKERNVLNFIL